MMHVFEQHTRYYICTLMLSDATGGVLLAWCMSATVSRASIVKASLLAAVLLEGVSWKSLKSELAPEALDTLRPSIGPVDWPELRTRRYTTTARMASAMVTTTAHAASVMNATEPVVVPALATAASAPTRPLEIAAIRWERRKYNSQYMTQRKEQRCDVSRETYVLRRR